MTLERLVQRIDPQARLLRTWPLYGGVSALVTALEVVQADGYTKKMIVRQHGDADLRHNPSIAADEYRLLQFLHGRGLPVPQPYYVDSSGEILSAPCIVLEYIEGAAQFAPANVPDFVSQSAFNLARIHSVNSAALSFLPDREAAVTRMLKDRPAPIDDTLNEGRIRRTLQAVWPLAQANAKTLLHGDFWPGNLLWKDGRLAAVIDWEDAALGDPLADLANTRLEMLWAFGIDAMRSFTQHYAGIMTALDVTHLPYWDLYAALRSIGHISAWTSDETKKQSMRAGHGLFVAQAFDNLPGA